MSADIIQQQRSVRPLAKTRPKAVAAEIAVQAEESIVGRTGWDVASGLLRAMKRPAIAIPTTLGLIGGVALLTFTGYVQVTYGKDGPVFRLGAPIGSNVPGSAEEVAADSLKKRIAGGHAANRPYVLDDVTVLVKIEDVVNGAVKERIVNWRIVYTVRALHAVTRTDKFFKERYSSDVARIRRWFGSEREIKETDNAYSVMLEIPAGETRTIVTGATFVYSLPLENNRPALGTTILLTPDQEFYSYPNDEDVIGELTLLIETDTLKMFPVGQPAKRLRADGTVAPDEEYRFNQNGKRRSLSAHWKDVMPKEEVGIHFAVE